MTARVVALALLAAVVPTAVASSRATDPPRIVPWHEIGNIGLGMSHKRVERMYGRAINGNPPADTLDWKYQGRGVIAAEYDASGNVELLDTTSPAYSTRSGIRVGARIPRGPCHRVGKSCQRRYRGFVFDPDVADGGRWAQWQRVATLGSGPLRVTVQLWVGRDDVVDEITLSQWLNCAAARVKPLSCRRPKPPYFPPPSGTRYCRKPGFSLAFLAASPEVPCATAEIVEQRVFSRPCLYQTRCEAEGFVCIAIWDGRTGQPFYYTHHADCRNDELRIEMDEG